MSQKSVTFQITLDLRAVALLSAALLLIGLVIAATTSEAVPRSGPQMVPTPGLDADMVDSHHAGPSNGTVAQRKNKVLWAGSNGKFSRKALPMAQLDNRYLNDDRAETIEAGPAGANLLYVHNTNATNAWSTLYVKTNGPGWAIHAESTHSSHNAGYFVGNVAQDRTYNGLAKAAVYVNGITGACIRGFNPYATTTCSRSTVGTYTIDFDFQVDDRYVAVSAAGTWVDVFANFKFDTVNDRIIVNTYAVGGGGTLTDNHFMVVVF